MAIEILQKGEWCYVPAPGRLDAFNFELTKSELERVAKDVSQIAIDVSGAHFISIPMIRFIHSLAGDLVRKGGRLALVGSSEKLKRQIHIFASLDKLVLFSNDNWEEMTNTSIEGHA
ncbi:MAG: hypothetical protein A2Z20_07535 [Bdellovibrionales bacterium RBG_16_40_8]|nr:MAG: hypothetical protein A2Z20_07535 [Bdellovibrionales bacterium RBG_16_40_8]